jgi:hypothetical protein
MLYKRKDFVVFKYKKSFIVHNTKKLFEEGHTHIENYHMCKIVIDNVLKSRVPKTTNTYLLISHVKLSTNEHYKKTLLELHDLILENHNKVKGN